MQTEQQLIKPAQVSEEPKLEMDSQQFNPIPEQPRTIIIGPETLTGAQIKEKQKQNSEAKQKETQNAAKISSGSKRLPARKPT